MSTLQISYNPYTVKTDLLQNDRPITGGRLYDLVSGSRLAQWIDSFLDIMDEELNSSDIKLIFNGTTFDAEDVKDAVSQFEIRTPEVSIETEYHLCTKSVDERVIKLKNLFEESQNGPLEAFRSDKIKKAFTRSFTPEFEVNVLATMSAGKSTVINAMLGQPLMPFKNEACTATIAKIHDYDGMEGFEGRRYDQQGDIIDDWQPVDKEILTSWNDNAPSELNDACEESPETTFIEIKGDIREIDERESIRLVLVDTPGPNNSRDASHRKATEEAITTDRPSMVLYILNATQLGTNDDKSLLTIIREIMETGGREAHDRFIFVANKIDNFDSENGESVEDALNNIRDYLQINGIKNPIVIPASAQFAMLLRTKRNNGTLTKKQIRYLETLKEDFLDEEDKNLLSHVKDAIGAASYRPLKQKFDKYSQENDEERATEILSGIPILEQLLDNYISKHAIPVRLNEAVRSFKEISKEMEIEEELTKIIQNGQSKIIELTSTMTKFQDDKYRLEEAKKFRDRVKRSTLVYEEANKQALAEVSMHFTKFLKEIDGSFQAEDLTISEAKNIMQNRQEEALDLIESCKTILEKNIKKDTQQRLKKLRQEYTEFVADILDKAFPKNTSRNVSSLQAKLLEMKEVEELIDDGILQKTVETHWYNPLDWFRNERIDTEQLHKEFTNELIKTRDSNEREYKSRLEDSFQQTKKLLLKEMDKIDGRIEKTINEYALYAKDEKETQTKIKENTQQLEWHKNFIHKLDEVLSINPSIHLSEEGALNE